MTTTPDPSPVSSGRRRWWWVAVGIVVVAAVIVAIVLTSTRDRNDSAGPTGSPSASVAPSATPTGSTPAPSATPSAAPDAAPTAVPLDGTVPVEPSVNVSLASIEAVDATADAPGEISGPALRVTVLVVNQSAAAVDLSAAIANLYFGADATPAATLDGSGAQPFPASVDAGGQATGVFVFTVPADQRDQVRIEVGYSAATPVAIFSGRAPA